MENIPIRELIKIIRRFSFKSIFLKYWKRFTLIIIIPFTALSCFVVIYFKNSSNDKIINVTSKTATMGYSSVSTLFYDADQAFTEVASNYYTRGYMSKPNEVPAYFPNHIINAFSQAQIKTNLSSIHLLRFHDNYFMSTDGGNEYNYFPHKDWYNYYNDTQLTNFVMNSSYVKTGTSSTQEVLSFCYGVYYQNICYGLMALNYNIENINSLLDTEEGDYFFIVNENKTILYSTDHSLIGKTMPDEYEYKKASQKLVYERNNNFLVFSQKIVNKPYDMVFVADLNYYSQNPFIVWFILLFVFLLAILIPLIISFYISLSFYHTIAAILVELSALGPNEDISKNSNEILFIMDRIMEMSVQNKSMEKELVHKMTALKNAQLIAMQLQFNQHFLFNTLGLISMNIQAIIGTEAPACKAISLLAELLRVSLDTDHYIVPIISEIHHSKNYIQIEELKLKNEFDVIWEIEDEVFEYKTVKLIFQPIIENAIRHGLGPLPRNVNKLLTIKGAAYSDYIEFHIIDNGVGFEPNILKEIQHSLCLEVANTPKHIGITNVNSRIKLIFGNDYGISIESSQSGSDVCIKIPKIS